MTEEISHGRKGSSAHQKLVKMATKKLIDTINDDFDQLSIVRDNFFNVKATTDVHSDWTSTSIAHAEQRLIADIACAAVKHEIKRDEATHGFTRNELARTIWVVECEINPRSNLLRDGVRLTAYKLIKQQNPNFKLILAVYEGTQVDNPGIFDDIWYFPKP